MILKRTYCFLVALALFAVAAARAENPFVGRWALTLPTGGAGWLGVEEKDGKLQGSILWGGGSVVPVASTAVEGGKLVVTRLPAPRAKKPDGKDEVITETITATLEGDALKLVTVKTRANGKEVDRAEFTGQRIPPLPRRPICRR